MRVQLILCMLPTQAETMGGFCVIAHALVLAMQTWHLEHEHAHAHDHKRLPPQQTAYLR